MKRFLDKATVVTGGAQGIGKAIAMRFAEEGSNVVVADINLKGAEKTAGEIEQLGRKALAVRADVTSKRDVGNMIDSTLEKFNKVDIAVNAAGIVHWSLLVDTEEQDWDRIFDVNTKGVFLCAQAAAQRMIKQRSGRIINIASAFGKFGVKQFCHYNASKAAVISFTQTTALELAPYQVTVNSICPGDTMTPMMQDEIVTMSKRFGMSEDDYAAQLSARIPLGRFGTPEEIAGLAAYLASDEASWITGQAFNICGGLHMG